MPIRYVVYGATTTPITSPAARWGVESLRVVERMDFDVLVPGHGPNGTRASVTAVREYAEDLICP